MKKRTNGGREKGEREKVRYEAKKKLRKGETEKGRN